MYPILVHLVPEAMAKNTSISLGDHFSHFVDERVAQGRYGSVSDVVRAGLRLLEEHETKLEALRAALIAGENSGPAAAFDVEDLVRQKRGSNKAGGAASYSPPRPVPTSTKSGSTPPNAGASTRPNATFAPSSTRAG
jgi:antitoxin ParD1/3/4